jgi:hypothetical protein
MRSRANSITRDILKSLKINNTFQTNVNQRFYKQNKIDKIREKLFLSVDRDHVCYTIMEYLDAHNPSEMNFYKFFENQIPLTDSMNPHYYYKGKDYFIKSVNGIKLKHYEELEKLLTKVTDAAGESVLNLINLNRYRGGILQCGERGSGKTFSQNIWLHENSSLLEENGIFWVRLDASKLFNIWAVSKLSNSNITSTKDYLLGQLVYVFSKHHLEKFPHFSKLFVDIAKKLKEDSENIINQSRYQNLGQAKKLGSLDEFFNFTVGQKGWKTITDILEIFEQEIAQHEGTYAAHGTIRKAKSSKQNSGKSFLVEKVFIDSQKFDNDRTRGSKNEWITVGERLRSFILEQEYYILYIIDGLDNINFFDRDSEERMLKIFRELYTFPLKQADNHENELVLLSMRDTTYQAMMKWFRETFYLDRDQYKDVSGFYLIKQYCSGIQPLVFSKRIEYVLREYHGPECFMKKVIKEICENHIIPDESNWNSNIRCFLNNHLTLAKYITFRYYFAGQPDNFNIQKQIKTFENINYLVNGELFLDEDNLKPLTNKGFNFFNLFGYYRFNKNKERKPIYLIYIRIIQIVMFNPQLTHQDLLERTGLFDYELNDVEKCLKRLLITGMIKSHYVPFEETGIINYYVSNMGVYVLKMFLSNIHFLYYCSVDTLLPEKIIKGMKHQINNVGYLTSNKTFYQPNCIISALTFLEYLIQISNTELEILQDNKDPGFDRDLYNLPINKKELFSTIIKMVSSSLRDKEYLDLVLSYIRTKENNSVL